MLVNKKKSHAFLVMVIFISGCILLIASILLSISVGVADIKLRTIWEAVVHFDSTNPKHQVIRELRIPRTLASAVVGASFAVAGAMMQGMTRNPLADSSLLGLNAGAAFTLAICFAFFPNTAFTSIIVFAFIGASIGAGLVYGIGSMSKNGLTPFRLTLAGAAVSALLMALSQGIAIHFKVAQQLAFWSAGGVAGTTWAQLKIIIPCFVIALVVAIFLSRSITILSLGEEVAVGLGQRSTLIKFLAMIIVLILSGSAVAVVGAVGFIGLIIPHISRYLVGVDYRFIIPCSAILGSLLMVCADIVARMINPPYESPVGAITALIGVPFFLYLARKEKREM